MIIYKKINEQAITPTRGKQGDAGLDLYTSKEIKMLPHQTLVIPTDIAIQLPKNTCGHVLPRSGISSNGCSNCIDEYGNTCSPYLRVITGTIDSNYRGGIGIITYNQEGYSLTIPKGTRLAQIVIQKIVIDDLIEVDELENTNRGNKGFGSSGL